MINICAARAVRRRLLAFHWRHRALAIIIGDGSAHRWHAHSSRRRPIAAYADRPIIASPTPFHSDRAVSIKRMEMLMLGYDENRISYDARA